MTSFPHRKSNKSIAQKSRVNIIWASTLEVRTIPSDFEDVLYCNFTNKTKDRSVKENKIRNRVMFVQSKHLHHMYWPIRCLYSYEVVSFPKKCFFLLLSPFIPQLLLACYYQYNICQQRCVCFRGLISAILRHI